MSLCLCLCLYGLILLAGERASEALVVGKETRRRVASSVATPQIISIVNIVVVVIYYSESCYL